MVLPTRQAPAQHASRVAADVLEAVHDIARDEDDAAGTDLGGLIADGHLIEALDDEQNLFLFEMDMVGRAFAGLVPRQDDRSAPTPRSSAARSKTRSFWPQAHGYSTSPSFANGRRSVSMQSYT